MVIYGTDELHHRQQVYDLLRDAVAHHWHLHPLPAIQRGEHGKPFFPQHPGHHFNLSHTDTLALCALDDSPVGVDIQVIKPLRPRLPQRVCSGKELAWLGEEADRWERFTQLWALKECRVKQAGTGLTFPISAIAVPLPQPGESLYRLDGLWFRIYSGAGWCGAACGVNQPPETILWNFAEEGRRISPLQAPEILL